MNLFKKTPLFLIALMMISLSSCELIEDVLPLPDKDKPTTPSGPNYAELVVTDEATTNTVWRLKSLIGGDGTELLPYMNFTSMWPPELDIKSDGTFEGAMNSGDNYGQPMPWSVSNDTLHLLSPHKIVSISEAEMVLHTNEAYYFSGGKWTRHGSGLTYYYEKVRTDKAFYGTWRLKDVELDNGSFADVYPYGMNETITFRNDRKFTGTALLADADDFNGRWNVENAAIEGTTIKIGAEIYQVRKVTDTHLVLNHYFGPMGFYYIDPNSGYLYQGDSLTFYLEKE